LNEAKNRRIFLVVKSEGKVTRTAPGHGHAVFSVFLAALFSEKRNKINAQLDV
jgi:hypothetical protein